MQAVLFIGVQASGKSTFFRARFCDTHVRINLDMLRTRRRESILLRACLEAKQPFVVDNTNPTAADRARYVEPARAAGFRVAGYFFNSSAAEAIARNDRREPRARVPLAGLLGTFTRLQQPGWNEGFDELYHVRLAPDAGRPGGPAGGGGFEFFVEPWKDVDRRTEGGHEV